MNQRPAPDSGSLGALTLRQREVLQRVAEGQSAKQIAAMLAISPRTVEFHKFQLMETLGLHTNAELTRIPTNLGLKPGPTGITASTVVEMEVA